MDGLSFDLGRDGRPWIGGWSDGDLGLDRRKGALGESKRIGEFA